VVAWRNRLHIFRLHPHKAMEKDIKKKKIKIQDTIKKGTILSKFTCWFVLQDARNTLNYNSNIDNDSGVWIFFFFWNFWIFWKQQQETKWGTSPQIQALTLLKHFQGGGPRPAHMLITHGPLSPFYDSLENDANWTKGNRSLLRLLMGTLCIP